MYQITRLHISDVCKLFTTKSVEDVLPLFRKEIRKSLRLYTAMKQIILWSK